MTVSLIVGGTRFGGWTEVAIVRSLEHVAAKFMLSLTERWPGSTAARPIRVGERCEVELDGERVIRGHVDAASIAYDARTHRIRVAGRDLLADLIDSSAEIRSFSGATASFIASSVAAPFGIGVAGGAGQPLEKFAVEPGETAYEAIARAARLRGLLPVGDGLGGLVLASPSRSRASVALEVGENALSLRAGVDHSGRMSSYTVLGQQGGSVDFLTGEESAHVSATVDDAAVTRHRPWVQLADQDVDPRGAEIRARWEKSVRFGRSMRVDATVQGWRERPGGSLWQPGRLVPVRDRWLGLDGRDLLVVSVQWSLDARGTVTKLTLAHADAFQPEPATEASADSEGWIP